MFYVCNDLNMHYLWPMQVLLPRLNAIYSVYVCVVEEFNGLINVVKACNDDYNEIETRKTIRCEPGDKDTKDNAIC